MPGSGGSATIAQQAPATPAPTVNSAPTANAGSGSYTVQAGDSYWKIANRYGMSISQLQQLNGRSDYFLYPGQTIRVSGTAASTVEAPQAQTPAPTRQAEQTAPAQQAAPAAPQAQTSGGYVVKPGDTLYSIAQRYGVDVYKLIANNGGSAFIQVGQVVSFN